MKILIVLSLLSTINGISSQSLFQTLIETSNIIYFNETVDEKPFLSEYDFIIIGAGSGGSVMANRLSEVPTWKILLLEAGGEESMISDIPIAATYIQQTNLNWGYKADPSQTYCTALEDGVCNWPKGRALGGTSVLNFLIYTRGHRRDYDEWAELGNYGWSYDEILKYFIKSENVKIPELMNSRYRGYNGFLDIESSQFKTPLFNAFIQGGQELGYKECDPNGASQLGFSHAQATMRGGRRCSAAKAFIRPILRRPNLHVSLRSWVTRILIEPSSKRAYGVEFMKNRQRHIVRAKKEVILSAGAIASPQLLMLSGVGPADNLREVGVDLIQDLKVGYNMQDHNLLPGLTFLIKEPVAISDTQLQNPIYAIQYLFGGQGPLTVPGGAEGVAFVKTENSTLPPDYPDIELVMGVGSISGDTQGALRRMLGITDDFFYKTYKSIIGKPAFSISPILMRSKSRGRISLKSRNPFKWPKMNANFFADQSDVTNLIKGIEMAIKLTETRGFKKFGTRLYKAPYYGCEKFQFRSYDYWECCIRRVSNSLQHQAGTCKMGPNNDPDAVVDPELRVYGIRGLRVVDASIMPILPASHTNAIVFMIGEKAADMVKTTWKG